MRPDTDGYATPAAAVICLALSAVAAAMVSRTLMELRLARADLARLQAEYRLEAAQAAALLAISTSTRPPPYRFTFSSLDLAVDVLAEPEYAKVSTSQIGGLEAEALAILGVPESGPVAATLTAQTLAAGFFWVADAADSPVWRACAAAYVSPYGRAAAITPLRYAAPHPGLTPSFWRAGEVWRIQVTDPHGWRDERIVRFTGDGLRPGVIIGRRLSRNTSGEHRCETLFGGGVAA